MSLSPRRRDAVRVTVTSLTALVGAGSLATVGWFAGSAARQQSADQARADAEHAAAVAKAADARARYDAAMARRRAAAHPRVVLRPRPTRTVVRTQYVSSAAAPVTVGGGTFTPQAPSAPAPAPHPGPVAQPAPPPPPPPPPPAPSSGSHHG